MSGSTTISDQESCGSVGPYNHERLESRRVSWSICSANSCILRHPILFNQWSYEAGVVLKGIEQVWFDTGDPKYMAYIKRNIDQFVMPDGSIQTYFLKDYSLDQINMGKLLFHLHQETGDERYRLALQLLMMQLATQPRTSEGGFWHKKVYPFQMWLDGIYMAAPFCAQYARYFDEPAGFDTAAHQILLIERHARDTKTGLFFHGWDESRMQKWANVRTGCSPHFWGRAVGWFAMAIVDVLEFLPTSHQTRDRITTILERMVQALAQYQDRDTGLWYQILDLGEVDGNYTEASASCMFVYALAKGIRKGYLALEYLTAAQRGYGGILEHLVEVDECGHVNLNRICATAGLGGEQRRDGSYEYYISEPVVSNDHKGIGAFLLASTEMEKLSKPPGPHSA
jgi:unsaturated rhamnogalacturonyl hydrolase